MCKLHVKLFFLVLLLQYFENVFVYGFILILFLFCCCIYLYLLKLYNLSHILLCMPLAPSLPAGFNSHLNSILGP